MDNTGKLALVSFLTQLSIVKFSFTLVYYLREKGLSPFLIGAFSSVVPVVYFSGCLLFARVISHLHLRTRVVTSLLGMSFMIFAFIFMKTPLQIFSVLFLYGLFQSLIWTSMETWITQNAAGERLTKNLAVFNFSWSGAAALSSLLGGFLVTFSYSLSFFLDGAVFLLSAFIALTAGEEEKGSMREDDELSSLPPSPVRFSSWLGVFIIYTGYSMVMVVFPQYALDVLGFSSSVTGRLLFFRGLSVAAFFIILKKFTFWTRGRWPVILMLSAFSFITILFRITTSYYSFVILFILYGAVFALGYNESIYHSAYGGGKRHIRMAVHEALITAGQISGSLLGGAVYSSFSFTSLVTLVSLLGTAAVIWASASALLYCKRETKKDNIRL